MAEGNHLARFKRSIWHITLMHMEMQTCASSCALIMIFVSFIKFFCRDGDHSDGPFFVSYSHFRRPAALGKHLTWCIKAKEKLVLTWAFFDVRLDFPADVLTLNGS